MGFISGKIRTMRAQLNKSFWTNIMKQYSIKTFLRFFTFPFAISLIGRN